MPQGGCLLIVACIEQQDHLVGWPGGGWCKVAIGVFLGGAMTQQWMVQPHTWTGLEVGETVLPEDVAVETERTKQGG